MLFTAPGQHASGGEQRASWATAIARDPDPDRGWGSQRNNAEYCNITSLTLDYTTGYMLSAQQIPNGFEQISIIFVLKKKHVYKQDSSSFLKEYHN